MEDHGLTGKLKLIANSSYMTLGIVALIGIYMDMRGFVLSEIEYQRADVRAWHDNVTTQHRDIIGRIGALSDKLDGISRDIRNKDKPQ